MNDESERSGHVIIEVLTQHLLEGLMQTMTNLREGSQSLGRNWKPPPRKYNVCIHRIWRAAAEETKEHISLDLLQWLMFITWLISF